MKMCSLGDLKRYTSRMIDDAQKDPIVVLVHGRPRALLLRITDKDLKPIVGGDVAGLKRRAFKSHKKAGTARGKKGGKK